VELSNNYKVNHYIWQSQFYRSSPSNFQTQKENNSEIHFYLPKMGTSEWGEPPTVVSAAAL